MRDDPVLLRPGEGEGNERFTILADRDELVLTEFRYGPGQDGPPRHIHRHHADAFYVLEGELRITLDVDDRVLGPGGFVLIPPGVIHTFGNPGEARGRYLNFHAPGMGFAEYLRGRNPDFDQEYEVPPGSGRPTSEAKIVEPGEGELLDLGPSRSTVMGGADDGMGSLAVLESTVAPGFSGPVRHVHERMVDSFYVREGTLALELDGTAVEAGPGSYALVPLELMAPAGFEGYLRDVASIGGPLDAARMSEIASRYDFRAI
jgi:mannose-6-phosphate isomerase-like protein (cupin superfamily)